MDKLDLVLTALGIVLSSSIFTPVYTFIVYELVSAQNGHYFLTVETLGLQGVSDVNISIKNVNNSTSFIQDASDPILKNSISQVSHSENLQFFAIKRMLANEKVIFDFVPTNSSKIGESDIVVKSNEVNGIMKSSWNLYWIVFLSIMLACFLFFYFIKEDRKLNSNAVEILAIRYHENQNRIFNRIVETLSEGDHWFVEIESKDGTTNEYKVNNNKQVEPWRGRRPVF